MGWFDVLFVFVCFLHNLGNKTKLWPHISALSDLPSAWIWHTLECQFVSSWDSQEGGPAKFCSMRRILACLFVSSWWLAYLSHHDFLLAFLSHHRLLILITHLHTDRHRCQLVDLEDSFPDCVDLPPYNCWIIVSRLTSLKNKKKQEKMKKANK